LIEKLKNEINIFSEFSRLKKAIPKEWYVQLSEEKSVKTTINIKKENIISAGRVIDMDKLVNKDFYNIIKNKVFIKPISLKFSIDLPLSIFILKISQFFPNLSKYFLGITFQFDVFELSSLLTHDTLSDLK
jgi:hypothetical protein